MVKCFFSAHYDTSQTTIQINEYLLVQYEFVGGFYGGSGEGCALDY